MINSDDDMITLDTTTYLIMGKIVTEQILKVTVIKLYILDMSTVN